VGRVRCRSGRRDLPALVPPLPWHVFRTAHQSQDARREEVDAGKEVDGRADHPSRNGAAAHTAGDAHQIRAAAAQAEQAQQDRADAVAQIVSKTLKEAKAAAVSDGSRMPRRSVAGVLGASAGKLSCPALAGPFPKTWPPG
jgi:hypothetical protein